MAYEIVTFKKNVEITNQYESNIKNEQCLNFCVYFGRENPL